MSFYVVKPTALVFSNLFDKLNQFLSPKRLSTIFIHSCWFTCNFDSWHHSDFLSKYQVSSVTYGGFLKCGYPQFWSILDWDVPEQKQSSYQKPSSYWGTNIFMDTPISTRLLPIPHVHYLAINSPVFATWPQPFFFGNKAQARAISMRRWRLASWRTSDVWTPWAVPGHWINGSGWWGNHLDLTVTNHG